MDRFSRLLAGLLGRAARLLPGRRREWAEAALNAFLLIAPIIGLVLGGVAATIACGGVPREDPAGARPGRGNDVRRATAPGDA
jgi:hypothetical protein